MNCKTMDREEEIYWDVAISKAEWASRRGDHSKNCLNANSEWPSSKPGHGACGRHMFPGDRVVLLLAHRLDQGSIQTARFGVCEGCYDVPPRGESIAHDYAIHSHYNLDVRLANCHHCGYLA